MLHKKLRFWGTRIIVLLLLAVFVLSACSPAAPEVGEVGEVPEVAEVGEEDKGEITVLYLDDPPFWREQAERFTEATGIKVNWVGVPFGQLHTEMLTTFAAGGSVYDVIHVRDDYVAEFASRGFLLPLDDYITQDLRAAQPERAWDNLSWDGIHYGVPRYFWMWQFYYNTEIFANAGIDEVPRTYTELAEMAGQLTLDTTGDGNIDQYAYCAAWGENLLTQTFMLHLLAAGGEMFNEDLTPAFNSEAGRRALQWMVDMAETDYVCPAAFELQHSGSLAELFAQGNIAMITNSTQTYRLAEDPDASRVVGLISAELAPGDVVPSATQSETGGLAIPASSQNPDAAFEYIKFVTGFEEQKLMAMTLSSIPTNSVALLDAEVQAKFPHFAFVEEQMQHPFGMIKHPNGAEVNRTMAIIFGNALRGQISVEDALEQAEREVLAIN